MMEASQLMKGADGTFKPFEQFQREVQRIDSAYNRSYLQAEYNFAVQSTQMAVKWKEWEKDGDDYDLQYRTAGDDRVREEHALLNGTTLPPSDPFWDNYLPPLGWNCRCTAVQVRKGKYPQSDSAEAIAKGQSCTAKPKQQIFRFNPGKQEKIFPPKHPYYKAPGEVKKSLEEYRKNEMISEMPDNLTKEQKEAIAQNCIDIENSFGISKGNRMTVEEADEQKANPNYVPKFIPDPNGNYIDKNGNKYSKNTKYKPKSCRPYEINCATCAPAYELRKRGFDVKAKGRVEGSGSLNDSVAHNRSFEMWKNADGTPSQPNLTRDWMASKGYNNMNKDRYEEYFNEACKENGTYLLTIGWRGGGGHATILEREDGKLSYVEPQLYSEDIGAKNEITELSTRGTSTPHSKLGILRIDDKVFDTTFLQLFDR